MILRRWRWLLIDVVLAALACVAFVGLVREVVEGRPLPAAHVPESPPRPAVPDPADGAAGAAEDRPGRAPAEYGVIAARNLFAVSRGEVAVVTPVLAGVKSVLHGVVIDGERSRAYLDDPVAKRVFGYAVGDTVVGGRLERILDDRVVIRGPAGVIEVLLQDPTKPQAEAPAPVAMPSRARRAGAGSLPPTSPEPAPPPAAGKVDQ
jgi:hypothetical protein